ncbi:hypothetical protein P030_04005 [Anaplasma phagocytophilum str. CRT35]|nr:hypothetical protein P030_04005 [Anaplasma phagocytophilum str. CRT35]
MFYLQKNILTCLEQKIKIPRETSIKILNSEFCDYDYVPRRKMKREVLKTTFEAIFTLHNLPPLYCLTIILNIPQAFRKDIGYILLLHHLFIILLYFL